MKKKLLITCVVITVIVSIFAIGTIPASAATEYTDGYLTYTVSDGKATITYCDRSISGAYTIPSTLGGYPVTSIGSSAFEGCSSLTSITIPSSVTSIGWFALAGCSSLTSASIPNSVTNIGESAFGDCDSLMGIIIPNSVTSIGISAFYGCNSLTSITIPSSVTSIGERAFGSCDSLTSINVNSNNANYCSENGVLFNKYKTEIMCYPSGKTSTSYTIPNSVTNICDFAFEYCSSLTSVTIPDGVISIGYGAFCVCDSLTSITIPDSVTSIGWSAFLGCSSLTSVEIGDGVTSIGWYAFDSCSSLTSITIPDSVTSIGFDAFYDCSKLSDVYYTGTIGQWNSISFDSGNQCLTSAKIHAKPGAKNGWQYENGIWYYYENDVKVKNAWREDSNGWCFLDEEGRWVLNSFVKDSTNKWAYITPNGYYYETTGWVEYDGHWYYLEKGYRVENDWRKDSTGWCFLDEEGKWVLNAFVKDSTGMWAYITPNGYYYETTGWIQYDGGWYYLERGYAVTSQWRKDSVGWCYLSESGRMVTNDFVPDSMGLCYIGGEGYMLEVTGWQLHNDQWYYLQNGYAVTNDFVSDSVGLCYIGSNGYVIKVTDWKFHKGQWYYLENGYAVTNEWRLDSKGWCYLGYDGAMLTNTWKEDSNGWCYIGADGYCLTGNQTIDGIAYTFNNNGVLIGNRVYPDEIASLDLSIHPTEKKFSDWREAYIYTIEYAKHSHNKYALINIDDDNIPELYMMGSFESVGEEIYSFKNGVVYEVRLSRTYGSRYIENSGIVYNDNGNMGYYYTEIYKLDKDGFSTLFYGTHIEETTQAGNGRYETSYIYSIGGKEVTKEEYYNSINSYFNLNQSVSTYKNAVGYESIKNQIKYNSFK